MGAVRERDASWVAWRVIFPSALAFLTVPPAVLGWVNEMRERQKKAAVHLGYVISVTSGSSIGAALF
jgi:hypothetical protein